VLGKPANLSDGIPVLLTLAAHPAERRACGPCAGENLPSPARWRCSWCGSYRHPRWRRYGNLQW
jgi:hypothetical protein